MNPPDSIFLACLHRTIRSHLIRVLELMGINSPVEKITVSGLPAGEFIPILQILGSLKAVVCEECKDNKQTMNFSPVFTVSFGKSKVVE